MFYCENCQKQNSWPKPSSRSKGRCEVCDAIAVCFDCPSSALTPGPQAPPTKYVVERLYQAFLLADGSVTSEAARKMAEIAVRYFEK
jgi:hypothetical protein